MSAVSRSLAVRAALALALMIGFYGFALAISAVLLAIPFAEYRLISHIEFRLLGLCWGSAATILWALVPRPDKFVAPGPQLTKEAAPELFDIIDRVASSTRQTVPADVYLVGDVNAWVSHRGGFMGFGSRRVMGVGLPLLRSLNADEVCAVVAHEFGHYCSGDVSLGPWIYKTRGAIGRSLVGVRNTVLEGPFVWYARMFMRMTMAVSRRQESVADETAARVAGAPAMVSALRKVAALGPAYSSYFRNEVLPVLRAGFLPPIANGFTRFLSHPAVRASVAEGEAYTLGEKSGEFDSHPPLADRIAAIQGLNDASSSSEKSADLIQVKDADRLATTILVFALGPERVKSLKPIQWEGVAGAVYAPYLAGVANTYDSWFGSLTADTIPSGQRAYIGLGSSLVGKQEINVNSEERINRAMHVMTAGLTAALIRSGWKLETGPGHSVDATKDGERLVPNDVVGALASESLSQEEWRSRCLALGLTGLPLRPSTSSAAVNPR